MLLLIFAGIAFAFLVVGSLVFLACVVVPPARKFALSAALWCAMWGPCAVGLMTIAGLGFVAEAITTKNGDASSLHWPKLLVPLGSGYVALGIVATIAVATGMAWMHQVLVHRFTFALFRLYATCVCAGIGSVFGWCLVWWLMARSIDGVAWVSGGLGMLLLVLVFGVAGYKGARALRGEAPTNFTWISREEFAGRDG